MSARLRSSINGMPKPSIIQNYRTWRSIRAVLDEKDKGKVVDILNRDFAKYPEQAKIDIDKTEVLMDKLWGKVITLVCVELFEKKNQKLLSYYQLENE